MTIKKRHLREPSWSDIIAFVEEKAILVNDPLFSNNTAEKYLDRTDKLAKKWIKCFITRTKEWKRQEEIWSRCLMCNTNHGPYSCNKCKQLAVVDRGKFLTKSKLCFGCYNPFLKDHNRRNCKKRSNCNICKAKYPKVLHGYKPKIKDGEWRGGNNIISDHDRKSAEAGEKLAREQIAIYEDVISRCAAPIRVKYRNSNFAHSTFAILGNCSQECFIKTSLVNSLKSEGWENVHKR